MLSQVKMDITDISIDSNEQVSLNDITWSITSTPLESITIIHVASAANTACTSAVPCLFKTIVFLVCQFLFE